MHNNLMKNERTEINRTVSSFLKFSLSPPPLLSELKNWFKFLEIFVCFIYYVKVQI